MSNIQEDRPSVIRDLRGNQKDVTFPHHDAFKAAQGRRSAMGQLMYSGGWRRPFRVFTYIITGFVALGSVTIGVGEKDRYGRDHVFSGLHRWLYRQRDTFLGIEPESKDLDVSSPSASVVAAFSDAYRALFKRGESKPTKDQ